MKGKFMFNKKICIILSLLLVCIYFNLQIQAMANQHSPHPNLPTQVLYDKNITTKIDKRLRNKRFKEYNNKKPT